MALKINKEPKSKSLALPGSLFYKEDLKKIYSTLNRRSADGEVEVKVQINGGEYEIDDLDDFDDPEIDSRKFQDVKYEASYDGSTVVVEVGRKAGNIIDLRKDDDILMSGVAEKVLEIAQERENHLKFFSLIVLGTLSAMAIYLLAVRLLVDPIIWIFDFFEVSASREVLVDGELLGLILGIIYIPCMIYGMSKMGIKGNTVVNSPRGKAQMFRDRIRDNWQVSAFWAFISATLGFLLGKFL